MVRKKMVIVDPEKIEWEPVEQFSKKLGLKQPKHLSKGLWVKLLSHDEETGAMAVLGKFDKGFHESKHTHPSDAHFVVLEGKLVDEKGNEIKRGMYCFTPAGVEHGPYEAPEGCVLFVYLNGPPW